VPQIGGKERLRRQFGFVAAYDYSLSSTYPSQQLRRRFLSQSGAVHYHQVQVLCQHRVSWEGVCQFDEVPDFKGSGINCIKRKRNK